jgi:hypothetical protein
MRMPATPAPLINMYDPEQVRYWAEQLDVSPEGLERAVDQVGIEVEDVRSFLARGAPAPQ